MPCSQSQFATSYKLAVSSQTCSAVSHNCLCDTTTCQTRLDLMLHKMKLGLLGHTILDLVSSIEHVLVNLLNLKFQQCKCTEQAQTIVRTIIEILQCTHTYIPCGRTHGTHSLATPLQIASINCHNLSNATTQDTTYNWLAPLNKMLEPDG